MEKKYKLLLTTDYSEAVMNAERYAVQFAKNTNSTLVLLHVYQIPFVSPTEPTEFSQSNQELHDAEMKRLEQHRDRLFRTMNLKTDELICECIVLVGSAGKQIRKGAKESDADFIIVGTHGASKFREAMLRSHTWDVIKKANIPVLAVPKDALFTRIKNIVFATEYREGEIPVINFLTQFAKQFDAEVTILHITNYVLSKELEKVLFEKFRDEVKSKNSYKQLNIRLAHYDDIVTGLNDYCIRTKTDMLVMSPEKPFIWEKIFTPLSSVTRQMSFHNTIPVLTIPDFYNPTYASFWKMFADAGDFVNEDF